MGGKEMEMRERELTFGSFHLQLTPFFIDVLVRSLALSSEGEPMRAILERLDVRLIRFNVSLPSFERGDGGQGGEGDAKLTFFPLTTECSTKTVWITLQGQHISSFPSSSVDLTHLSSSCSLFLDHNLLSADRIHRWDRVLDCCSDCCFASWSELERYVSFMFSFVSSQLTRRSSLGSSFIPSVFDSSNDFNSLVFLPLFSHDYQNDQEGSWEDDRFDVYPSWSHDYRYAYLLEISISISGERIEQQHQSRPNSILVFDLPSFKLDSTSIFLLYLDFDLASTV